MEQIFKNIKQRDIYLVPFPFSDFSGSKVRPILVVSNNHFNNNSEDVIICGVTSNLSRQDYYTIKINNDNLEEGHLITLCCVKTESILKIDKKLLIKKIGSLKKEIFDQVLDKLNSIFK